MTPEHQSTSDPDALQNLKDSILAQWRQLPPEAAAAVMVEQLRLALEGGLISPEEADPRFRPFVAASVCRADLEEYFGEEEIAQFDDGDMKRLAETMGDWYLDESYWHDLETIGRLMLDEKVKKK